MMVKALPLSLIFSACLSVTLAQNQHVVSGIVVLHPQPHLHGSYLPVKNVVVKNKNTGMYTSPNSIGYFEISGKIGDYLEASIKGFPTQTLLITKYDNIVFDMDSTIRLQEVVVTGLRENEKKYESLKSAYAHKNTLLFGGRPPAELLSPIGGSPASFFYELLSKEGKKARKLNAYIQTDVGHREIENFFNEEVVKNVIPDIIEKEIERYMELYTPDLKPLRKWSEYELIQYIKTTYKLFKADRR